MSTSLQASQGFASLLLESSVILLLKDTVHTFHATGSLNINKVLHLVPHQKKTGMSAKGKMPALCSWSDDTALHSMGQGGDVQRQF